MTEQEERAADLHVAPAGVVPGHPFDQRDHGGVGRRAAPPSWVGPVLGGQTSVPGQHGLGGDQALPAQQRRQLADQSGEQEPVGPVELRLGVGPAQALVLVS
ncbi:MAG: hypothetical protein JXA67_01890 [Micromonosporaceae bacterium]|nr:hypothetical protein [Micromonosporaceae bacterium]